MKFSSRGFTLVELMIVIAIIGILAAALFPSLTAYLKRSRDAGRAANMNSIATALGAFYADRETYPSHVGGSVNSGSTGLSTSYMPKGVPTDPLATNNNGGATNGTYGYGSGVSGGSPFYTITARFENDFGGNTGSIASWTGSPSAQPTTAGLVKGVGSGYILTN